LTEKLNLHYASISAISGMAAGISATILTHPLEIVRVKIQV